MSRHKDAVLRDLLIFEVRSQGKQDVLHSDVDRAAECTFDVSHRPDFTKWQGMLEETFMSILVPDDLLERLLLWYCVISCKQPPNTGEKSRSLSPPSRRALASLSTSDQLGGRAEQRSRFGRRRSAQRRVDKQQLILM